MLKFRIIKYWRLLRYNLDIGRIKRNVELPKVQSLGVFVSINPKSTKFTSWHDGFTEAIKQLQKHYDVSLIHFDEKHPQRLIDEINLHDFIIVKSAWRTPMDYFLRNNSAAIKPYLGLMISASNHGPSKAEQAFYHVVWYETEWYKKRSVKHRNAIHAFGIDTTVMKLDESAPEKKYDIITVGAPRRYKRLELLLEKEGKRLLIGDLTNRDNYSTMVLDKLSEDGVDIEDFQDYQTLAKKYQQAKTCYIPCKLHGGGERSLLEARACGLEIEIEKDNPKLAELIDSPIWDSQYYYEQLKKGIASVYR